MKNVLEWVIVFFMTASLICLIAGMVMAIIGVEWPVEIMPVVGMSLFGGGLLVGQIWNSKYNDDCES